MTNRVTAKRVKGGHLPFVGHGLRFMGDCDNFIDACQREYGDVFKLQLGNKTITLLVNPHDIDHFFRAADKMLGTQQVFIDASRNAFGISADTYVNLSDTEFGIIKDELKKNKLEPYNRHMQAALEDQLFKEVTAEYQVNGLYDFAGRLIFIAGSNAIFGKDLLGESDYTDFRDFDSYTHFLLNNMPSFLFPKAVKARKRLLKATEKTDRNRNPFMVARYELYDKVNLCPFQRSALTFAMFWVTNTNTVNAMFWIISIMLQNKEVSDAIMSDINSLLQKDYEVTEHGLPKLTNELMADMKNIDSITEEALRLTTSVMNMRQTPDDLDFLLHSGETLSVKKGDFLAVYPRWSQLSAEVFPEPERFKWDRHINNPEFSYKNEKLKTVSYAFGAGSHICPGRFFARNEFKITLLTLLLTLDIEAMTNNVPVVNQTFAGTGVMPPVGDIQVRYRLKPAK
ncbi:MAG TPA: cytochrome P450 [Pseudomonadales bacterium]|nr:cytochrome P450 [Pseudomonadales bacterium]